jgi:molecular chaperone GrpE (heat shock protein)
VNEYDNNLKIIIPETEKLKNRIKAQEEQIAALTNKLDRLRNESEQQIKRAKQETEEVDAMHAKCKGIISKLSEKVDTVSHELEIARRVRKEVRVEPVYIDRPV